MILRWNEIDQIMKSNTNMTVAVLLSSLLGLTQLSSSYSIRGVNDCDKSVYFHILTASGSVNTTVAAVHPGESTTFSLDVNPLSQLSVWTLWISDDPTANVGPSSSTGSLVEMTTDLRLNTSFVDISNVNALTNSWTVVPDVLCKTSSNTSCDIIACNPRSDWVCPYANRVVPNQMTNFTKPNQPYLSEQQVCMSNCTLTNSFQDCCTGPNSTAATCSNTSPSLKEACPAAYSWAYDDAAAIRRWEIGMIEGPIATLRACS